MSSDIEGTNGFTVERLTVRVMLFAPFWIVLAGPDPWSWVIGLPTVLVAALLGLRLAPVRREQVVFRGAMGLLPFFLWQSVRGGLDVARRILQPRLAIDPGFRVYRTRLSSRGAQVLFLNAISLIPGTLSTDLRGGRLRVHTIDVSMSLTADLATLERLVGALFGERLGGSHDG